MRKHHAPVIDEKLPAGVSNLRSIAPLALTRHTIIVPVHLGVRTVLDEIGRFGTRVHLGAMGPSVAAELSFGWSSAV